jgi:hypothetical protein
LISGELVDSGMRGIESLASLRFEFLRNLLRPD